ncbi:MAG: hypothetical protein R3204_15815, partial [Oceanospirillum sp.]|nr:hypothetical protein [Oceanospirillum sp.]
KGTRRKALQPFADRKDAAGFRLTGNSHRIDLPQCFYKAPNLKRADKTDLLQALRQVNVQT